MTDFSGIHRAAGSGRATRELVQTCLRRRATRSVALLLAAVVLGLHPGAVRGGTPAAAPGPVLEVSLRGGMLTVNVRDVPLADLLREIGERAAVRVSVGEDVGDQVTAAFVGLPLDEGIRRLARGNSVVLVYRPSPDRTGQPRLAEVQIYRSSLPRPGLPTMAQSSRTTPGAAVASVGVYSSVRVEPADDDDTMEDRFRAIWVMGRPGDARAASGLARILADDPDPVARIWAVRALGQVGGDRALGALDRALTDTDRGVRLEAITAYSAVAGASAVAALGGMVTGDPEPEVRRHAVQILARLGTPEALEVIAPATFDPSDRVRQAADAVSRAPRAR